MARRGPTPAGPGDLSDQELLNRLAAALGAPDVEPDPSSLRHLSAAVSARWSPPPSPSLQPTAQPLPHRLRWPRRLSPLALAGASVGALITGTGISYAVGGPAPAPVRSIVRNVGLAPSPPTTASTTVPPAVTEARRAESTLRHALASKNVPPAVVSRDSSELARLLGRFGSDREPWALGTSADGRQLLVQACRQLYGEAPASRGTTGTSTNDTSTTSRSTTTTQPASSNDTNCSRTGSWTATSPGYPPNGTSTTSTTPTTPTTSTGSTYPGTARHRRHDIPSRYGVRPSTTSTTYENHYQWEQTTTPTSQAAGESTTTTSTTSPAG